MAQTLPDSVVPPRNPPLPNIGAALRGMLVPILAVFTAVLIGSVFILFAGLDPFKAYAGLLNSALGSDTGLTETLLRMTPYILSGLAVAFAFKGGLFNIGTQGQLFVGSLTSAWAGFAITGLPPIIHVFVAMAAGILGGALWGLIPGLLKAYTGAHEVISTIMLNYIAGLLLDWVVRPASANNAAGPLAFYTKVGVGGVGGGATGKTPPILPSAYLPVIYQTSGNTDHVLHLGVFLAVGVALLTWLVLYRTTFGFELRTVGLNPDAARYAGINVRRMTVLTLMISGGLAGLAGAIQTQGLYHEFQTNQNLTVGFESIAVALLAGNSPIGIIPSAFLFGALGAGSKGMQLASGVSPNLIQVIQALILMFVAADQIIRYLYRIKKTGGEEKVALSTGWARGDGMDVLALLTTLAIVLNLTIRAAVPIILGALSGIVSERSGIVNIGIEGMMLAGAFCAYTTNVLLSQPTVPAFWQLEPIRLGVSILAALVAGILLALLHALLSIRFKVDQIISGTVLNILASGVTGYLYINAANTLSVLPILIRNPFAKDTGVLYDIGVILFDKTFLTYLTFILVPLLGFALFRTTWGLRTRAIGENPRAADTLGIDVHRLQYTNLAISGMLAGLAGSVLILSEGVAFERDMTNGRGFIALAVMIFGIWRPSRAMWGALLFGFASALQSEFQLLKAGEIIPHEFIGMLPYILTLVVLAGFVGRARPPAHVGQVYEVE